KEALARGSRPPARGRLAAAMPPARGGRLQPRPPCKGAANCGQAPCKERPPAGTTGCGQPARGGGVGRRGGRPLAGRLPAAKGSRCLCRGIGDGCGYGKGEGGLGNFLRKRWLCSFGKF
ncbi:hypothetical protein GW17_00048066, partial [Ensete ventricosum]